MPLVMVCSSEAHMIMDLFCRDPRTCHESCDAKYTLIPCSAGLSLSFCSRSSQQSVSQRSMRGDAWSVSATSALITELKSRTEGHANCIKGAQNRHAEPICAAPAMVKGGTYPPSCRGLHWSWTVLLTAWCSRVAVSGPLYMQCNGFVKRVPLSAAVPTLAWHCIGS